MAVLIFNWIKISKRKVEEEGDMSPPEWNYAEILPVKDVKRIWTLMGHWEFWENSFSEMKEVRNLNARSSK